VAAQGLQLAQHDLVPLALPSAVALQLLAALLQVAADRLHVVGKDHVACLLPPHDGVNLSCALLHGFSDVHIHPQSKDAQIPVTAETLLEIVRVLRWIDRPRETCRFRW
jgi:hypothetical protein